MTNLITSCFDCNMGKRDTLLDDNSMLEKQKKQLEELNERRLQLEMMMEWREGLMAIEQDKINYAAKKWRELLNSHYSLNEKGLKTLKGLIKKYGFNEFLDAMEVSCNQYLVSKDGVYTEDSVSNTWSKIKNILAFNQSAKDKPYLKDLFYLRGILKNRLSYVNPHIAINLLEKAYLLNASKESLTDFCKSVRNWTEFQAEMERYIDSQSKEGEEDES